MEYVIVIIIVAASIIFVGRHMKKVVDEGSCSCCDSKNKCGHSSDECKCHDEEEKK